MRNPLKPIVAPRYKIFSGLISLYDSPCVL